MRDKIHANEWIETHKNISDVCLFFSSRLALCHDAAAVVVGFFYFAASISAPIYLFRLLKFSLNDGNT